MLMVSWSGALQGGASAYAASGGNPIAAGLGALSGAFGSKKKRGPDHGDLLVMRGQEIKNEMAAIMENAKINGIHPTVALGLPPAANLTQQLGGDDGSRQQQSALAHDMGANIGSALGRQMSPDEKAISAITTRQALERGDLENELLKSQIAQNRASVTPGIFNGSGQLIPGQAQTGTTEKIKEIIRQATADGTEVGKSPSMQKLNYKGSEITVPGEAWANAGLDEGPAAWVMQLVNTVPDIIAAELKDQFVGNYRTGTKLGDKIANKIFKRR